MVARFVKIKIVVLFRRFATLWEAKMRFFIIINNYDLDHGLLEKH